MPKRSTRLASLVLLCFAVLIGCAGGSGSSGFDIVENAAIDQAIDEQRCIESGGLVICPADTANEAEPPRSATPSTRPTATATRAVQPTRTRTPTPEGPDHTPSDTPIAIATETATPTRPAPPATSTPTPTRSPTPTPAGMRIDIGIDRSAFVDCLIVSDTCGFSFAFTASGFPDNTSYLVASRRLAPESPWRISIPVAVESPGEAPGFDALIAVPVTDGEETITVQIAVLAQSAPVDSAPASVDALGDSAAEFAFVTPELQVQPIR